MEDWSSQWQVQNCELAGLATFNENNNDYRAYMKRSIRAWLDKGVDALRVDTVKHMPLWFWQEFTADLVSHKPDLFMFGEWIYANSNDASSVEFANKSGMALLDFGLCMAIRRALGSREPEGFRIVHDALQGDANYRFATELVTFLDNHDMPRFQSLGADDATLRLAVVLLILGRGTPCLYYGIEQHLHDDTNGGADPYNRPMMVSFDTNTPLYQDVAKLSALRRQNSAVQFGSQWQKFVSPDVYCFTRRYRGARCFVALNRGASTRLDRVETDLPHGDYTCALTGRRFAIGGGAIELELGNNEAIVLSINDEPSVGESVVRFHLNGYVTQPGASLAVLGSRRGRQGRSAFCGLAAGPPSPSCSRQWG